MIPIGPPTQPLGSTSRVVVTRRPTCGVAAKYCRFLRLRNCSKAKECAGTLVNRGSCFVCSPNLIFGVCVSLINHTSDSKCTVVHADHTISRVGQTVVLASSSNQQERRTRLARRINEERGQGQLW